MSSQLLTLSTQLLAPSSQLLTLSTQLLTSSSQLLTLSTQLLTPSSQLLTLSTQLLAPSSQLHIDITCQRRRTLDTEQDLGERFPLAVPLNDPAGARLPYIIHALVERENRRS